MDIPGAKAKSMAAAKGGGKDCGECSTFTGLIKKLSVDHKEGVQLLMGQAGGFSHEEDHDLAVMVNDYWENGPGPKESNGEGSRDNSDTDSDSSTKHPDLKPLLEKILTHKREADQYESGLLSAVNSAILSLDEKELRPVKPRGCKASCIRFSVVEHLRLKGYDAAVCASEWKEYKGVPSGNHEYINVKSPGDKGSSERMLIVDIDFQSHFAIASLSQVASYKVILESVPVVYVGSLSKLNDYLLIMVEAARSSFGQKNMEFPCWRCIPALFAKWYFTGPERKIDAEEVNEEDNSPAGHNHCPGHLIRFKSSIQSEVGEEQLRKLMKDVSSG